MISERGFMKEINFNSPTCKDTLLTGLNFYSQHYGPADSKKWALKWLSENDEETLKRVLNAKDHQFSNRGFLCRMICNGLVLSENEEQKLREFFRNIVVEEQQKALPVEKEKTKVPNRIIFQIEDKVDDILSGKEAINDIVIGDSKKERAEAVSWCSKEIIEIHESIDKLNSIINLINTVKTACETPTVVEVKPKKTPTLTPRQSNHKQAINAVKNISLLKKLEEFSITGLSPIKIPGASFLVFYNEKYRSINVVNSSTKIGVSLEGKTLSQVGTSSFTARVSDPRFFFDTFKTKGIDKALDCIKTKRNPLSSFRLTTSMILIECKDC